jgi:hypothetical protein
MVGSGTLRALGRTLREFHQGMAHTEPHGRSRTWIFRSCGQGSAEPR